MTGERVALAVAIDLGTTRIKGGMLGEDGRLAGIVSGPAPPIRGADPIRESDARAYVRAAAAVLAAVREQAGGGVPVGIASQRSTLVIWSGRTGEPVTRLISWQDRRAAPWCDRNRAGEPAITRLTGLPLSPHYAGPKLAALQEGRPDLRTGLRDGTLRLGTLEAYFLWNATGGVTHETDPTMAARTLLADARSGEWSPFLLDRFGVPVRALPRIRPTAGRSTPLGDASLAASIADQASGALALLGEAKDSVVVNLGTGGFVLRMTGGTMESRPGYLAGPVLGAADSGTRFALEGAINGAAISADRFGPGPTLLPDEDPEDEAFCLPDLEGTGSPHWRPDRTLTFSPAASRLPEVGKRRVVIEGIVFRVREILEDLFREKPPRRVLLSGGLARDPGLGAGLAAGLGRPVELSEEPEATLLGVARLAAGPGAPLVPGRGRTIPPGRAGAYLREKYARWRAWLARELET